MATAKKQEKPQRSDLNVPNDNDVRREELAANGEVPARFDAGSGEEETEDGLDEYQEATRHGAEDVPANDKRKTMSDIPVFDRAGTEPKV